MKRIRFSNCLTICLLLLAATFSSCGIYSFTGASYSPDLKTFLVADFPNLSSYVLPSLSQDFKEALRDKFLTNTNLALNNDSGDIEIEGAVLSTVIKPAASSGNDRAALNRLTVRIRVDYINHVEDDSWNKEFSAFADYADELNISDVEGQLLDEIIDQLTQQVFNEALVKW